MTNNIYTMCAMSSNAFRYNKSEGLYTIVVAYANPAMFVKFFKDYTEVFFENSKIASVELHGISWKANLENTYKVCELICGDVIRQIKPYTEQHHLAELDKKMAKFLKDMDNENES